MSVRISLRDIVQEMTEIGDNHTAFLDRRTGELLTLNDQHVERLESGVPDQELSDWQQRLRQALDAGEVLELPGRYEQKQFTIVERFCQSITNPDHKGQLLQAIGSKQAFRDFNTLTQRLGLDPAWRGFRDLAFEELAITWLDEHGIPYDRGAAEAA